MNRFVQRVLGSVLVVSALTACGGSQATTAPVASQATSVPAKPTTAPTTVPATAEPASDLGDILNNKGEKITLVVGGTATNPGTYTVESSDGACSTGLTGESGWGNQYSIETTDPKAFSSLQLIVNGETDQTNSNQFMTTISFGPLFSAEGINYDISTLDANNPKGTGTVKIDDKGDTATINIKGTTAEGVTIDATIECLSVLRFTSGDEPSEPATTNRITLTISGGELAGSYTFAPTSEVSNCGIGENNSSVLVENLDMYEDLGANPRANSVTFDYYDDSGTQKITSLQLAVAKIENDASRRFYLDINNQQFFVENISTTGDIGVVEVIDSNTALTMAINAKNSEGTMVVGTLECTNIER